MKSKQIAFLVAMLCPLLGNAQNKPTALKGLDPIELIAGKQVSGDPKLFCEFGKFKYLFATTADKQLFESSPDRYAVQHEGKCLMMPDMPGDPNLFVVYGGKIYLAGSDSCYKAVSSDPGSFLQPGDQSASKTVAILLFPGVEIIDYSGPWEVFGGAGYKVFTVAVNKDPIKTVYGETVLPDYTFADCPKAVILLLPGGGVPNLDKNDPTMQWIVKTANEASYTMSVCNGAFWLARAGLLDGKSATTTAGLLDRLASQFPSIHVVDDQRVVDNGTMLTTGGLSAGIDGALHLVEKIDGHDAAQSIAIGIEYNWDGNHGYAPGNFANKYFRRAGNISLPADLKVDELSSFGDDSHWEERWKFSTSSSSAADILAAIEETAAKAKWHKVETTNPLESEWLFRGDDGKTWKADYTLSPDPSSKTKFFGVATLETA